MYNKFLENNKNDKYFYINNNLRTPMSERGIKMCNDILGVKCGGKKQHINFKIKQ